MGEQNDYGGDEGNLHFGILKKEPNEENDLRDETFKMDV